MNGWHVVKRNIYLRSENVKHPHEINGGLINVYMV